MITFEQAVEAWLRRQPNLDLDGKQVDGIEVSHSDAMVSDAGTYWGPETTIHYTVTWHGSTGQRHTRDREVEAGNPIEFMRALFDVAAPANP